jgi:sugar O-acyltransferase (sialic acid O-acetyltransferase NeuD family)
MTLFAVYGASGFGREVMPLLRAHVPAGAEAVFIDDNVDADRVNGHRVMNWEAFAAAPAPEKKVTIAIANSQVREVIVAKCLAAGVGFVDVKADNVRILDAVTLGEGHILCGFVTLTSNVTIGSNFHANIYSYVAHDCVVGDFVTLAPCVQCNGNVVIEDHAYIGTGAVIRQGSPGAPVVIGRGAVVGMGAVVTKSVPPGVTVVGNPARPLVKS